MTKDRFSFVEFEGLDSDEKLIWINSYANCEILDHAQNNIPMMSINDAALLFSWLVHSNLPLRPQSRQNCISNSLLSLSSAIPKNNQAPVNSLAILKLLNDLLNYDSIQSDSKHKVNDTSKPGELILKHSSIVCQLLNITRSTPLQLWTNITQHSEKLIDIILQYCHVGIKRDANILSTAWQFILQAMEQLKNHSNIDLLLASVMASLAKQCCSHLTSIYRTPDHSLNSICILAKFYLSNLNILVKKMSHLLLSTHTLDSVFHILIVTRYIVMKEPYRTMTEASVVFKGLVSIPACLLQFGTFTFENRIFILNHFVSKYEFKYLSTFVALEDRDIYHSRVYFASLMFRYIEESSISSPISTSTTTVDTKQPMTQELVTVVDTFLRLIDQCYSFHFCGYQIESRSSLYDDALIGLILVILNLNLQTWTSIEKILWDRLLSSIQKHTVNFIIDVYLYLSDQGIISISCKVMKGCYGIICTKPFQNYY
ncbi:hypothetical protein BC833DRAFT_590348 [Globomyces pollinis-pini]|nr:hypothetical protein BC833DRAFT_590348 [Globomyces pollinis-pini]